MKKVNKLNVGIIIGGKSVEHDISILSGLQVYHAIDKDKYNVTIFYITKDNRWLVGQKLHTLSTYEEAKYQNLLEITIYKTKQGVYYKPINKRRKPQKIDVFIPVVHGDGIEDGTLSAYLDLLDIPYTSSSLTSSSIVQDKIYTKQILKYINIPMIDSVSMTQYDIYEEIEQKVNNKLGFPVIIKPSRLGSSIGISTASNNKELKHGIEEALKYGSRILIEKKIENMKEYNIALYIHRNQIITSNIEEVLKTDDILSFIDKYERLDKMEETNNRKIPAEISIDLETNIKNMCINIYTYLEMKGIVRIDTIYDIDNNQIYLNEINTIPGSLSFYLFDQLGISFDELINIQIKEAILSKQKENIKLKTFISNVLNKKSEKLRT